MTNPGDKSPPSAPRPAWPRLTLRRPDQAVAAALIATALVLLAGHWSYQTWWRSRLIEIDRAEPIQVTFQVDINQADWPEFCLLPGVGEALAKRIVDHRREHGPFSDLNSLREVRGIGPKTFEGLQPYLLPLPNVEATADESSASLNSPKT